MASQINTYSDGKFLHIVDPKDGYSVRDCRDSGNRHLLKFIMPIIHPNKPTRVTITIGNTIFEALNGGRLVDWEVVFWELARKMVARVGKPKPTSICPFLFHLYHSKDSLIEQEEINYEAARKLTSYRNTLDLEPQSNPVSEGEEKETRDQGQPRELPEWEQERPRLNRLKRMKRTYRAPQGSLPVQTKG